MPQSPLSVTKTGNYGDNATPTPEIYWDEVYRTSTITFSGSSAKIVDSDLSFADKHFKGGWTIRVATTSGINDGDYTISERGVNRGEILLEESLTDDNAPGEVVISRRIYTPNITTGCPLCGSLNSKE